MGPVTNTLSLWPFGRAQLTPSEKDLVGSQGDTVTRWKVRCKKLWGWMSDPTREMNKWKKRLIYDCNMLA